jgi:hypothetical protein
METNFKSQVQTGTTSNRVVFRLRRLQAAIITNTAEPKERAGGRGHLSLLQQTVNRRTFTAYYKKT